jgi:hypothetical protein
MSEFAGKRGGAKTAYVLENTWSANKITWAVFPPIQLFAIRFLPPQLWTPFFNLVGFIFGVYVNVAASRKA